MKNKILYLDMDGVIADFDKAINKINPTIQTIENPEVRGNLVDTLVAQNPTLFHTLEPIKGSIEATFKLFELFDVYFLSTPMWEIPESMSGKRIWLGEQFGEKCKKRLILTHRKDLNIGDYLVDDRLKNGSAEFTGEHIHFGTPQFPNWDVTFEYLKTKV